MESVPGAVATGSQLTARIEISEDGYPAATAAGTDLILKLMSEQSNFSLSPA